MITTLIQRVYWPRWCWATWRARWNGSLILYIYLTFPSGIESVWTKVIGKKTFFKRTNQPGRTLLCDWRCSPRYCREARGCWLHFVVFFCAFKVASWFHHNEEEAEWNLIPKTNLKKNTRYWRLERRISWGDLEGRFPNRNLSDPAAGQRLDTEPRLSNTKSNTASPLSAAHMFKPPVKCELFKRNPLLSKRIDFVLSKYSLSADLEADMFQKYRTRGSWHRVMPAAELHHLFSDDVTSLMKYLRSEDTDFWSLKEKILSFSLGLSVKIPASRQSGVSAAQFYTPWFRIPSQCQSAPS